MVVDVKPTEMRERGVSPVIGVVLLVAITVILAATVAFVFLGGGNTQEAAPSTVISETVQAQSAEYIFESGDEFSAAQASAVAEVVVEDTSSGTTKTVNFDTSLDAGETKSVTVGGTSVDVELTPSISGSDVQSGDSFEIQLSGASGVRMKQVDTSVVWNSGDQSSMELYSDSSEPVSTGGGGGTSTPGGGNCFLCTGGPGGGPVSNVGFSTSLDRSSTPTEVNADVTSGSFDGATVYYSMEVTLEDTSSGTTATTTFNDPTSQDMYYGNRFDSVGGGVVEYSSLDGADGDFSSGDKVADITIEPNDADVEVKQVRIGFVEKVNGGQNNVLYEKTLD